jgi:hypothetical protein
MDKPEYMKACDPFSDILDIAEKDLPNGASWNVWTTADNTPTSFVMTSATGQIICTVMPIDLSDISGRCMIMTSSFQQLSHYETALAAMLRSNELFGVGLLSHDMASVKTDIVMTKLETALNEMVLGSQIVPDVDTVMVIVNVAIAILADRGRTSREPMAENTIALIASYRNEVASFLTAIRQEDGPDWESASNPGYKLAIDRAKILRMVSAHLNSN